MNLGMFMNHVDDNIGKLLIALYSKQSNTRRQAIEELSKYADERILLRLVEHLDDSNKGVRDAIAHLLYEHSQEYPSIVEPLLRYIFVGNIEIKNLASEIIVHIGKPSIEYLRYALICDDQDVRKFIADILGFIGHPDAIPYLTEAFYDEDPNVGFSSIEAVGSIGSQDGINALKKICEENEELRAMSIEALGKIADQECLEFISGYFSDKDPMVVFSVLDALGHFKTSQSYTILKLKYSDLDEMGKDYAIKSLINIASSGTVRFVDNVFYPEIKKYILESGDEDFDESIQVFAKIRTKEVLADLLHFSTKFTDKAEVIIKAISENFEHETEHLLSAISSVNGNSFEVLLHVIAELELSEASEKLIYEFGKKDEEIKSMIISALGVIGEGEDVENFLLSNLESENTHLKSEAIKSIGNLGLSSCFEKLYEELAEAEVEEVAYAVLEAFVSMGGEQVITFFSEMFESDDVDDKSIAMQALAELDVEKCKDYVKELVHSDGSEEVELGISIISQNGFHEFDENLVQIFANNGTEVKKMILSFLMSLDNVEKFEETILSALQDEDRWVQIHAIEVLEQETKFFLNLLEKIDFSKLDEFSVRSLFDYLVKLAEAEKVQTYILEYINALDEDLREDIYSKLKKNDLSEDYLDEFRKKAKISIVE
jgi:HEAT repeat protein